MYTIIPRAPLFNGVFFVTPAHLNITSLAILRSFKKLKGTGVGICQNTTQDPEMYRYNVYLSDWGLMLRERLDAEGECRVLYDFDGCTIDILLFISIK